MGLVVGLMIGMMIGVLSDQLAIWTGLGLVFGVLAQGIQDSRNRKKPYA